MRKLTENLFKITKFFDYVKIPWFLPRLYLKIFIFGLVLVGLNYSYIPYLTYCSSLFGGEFCSPIGIYLIAFASLPGYLIVNALLPNIASNNDSLYSLIVFVTAIFTYSLLGYLISKKRQIKNKSTGLIYLIFLALVFIVLVLVSLIR